MTVEGEMVERMSMTATSSEKSNDTLATDRHATVMTDTSTCAVRDPYISVAIRDAGLSRLRGLLSEALNECGIWCENASSDLHVSIAYADGETSIQEIGELANQIANDGFNVHAHRFEVLQGRTTPFDYLVLTIDDSRGDFACALGKIEKQLGTLKFSDGFKCHVSLLRFAKGAFDGAWAARLLRELNATHGAACALGVQLRFEGECICVYGKDRRSICRIAC